MYVVANSHPALGPLTLTFMKVFWCLYTEELENVNVFICRLLVQLDETKGNFEEFWTSHERRMRQALHLRKFEDDFKLVSLMHIFYFFCEVEYLSFL